MQLRSPAPSAFTVLLSTTLALAGCSCGDDDRPDRDSGTDSGPRPDGDMLDGGVDGGPIPDGDVPDGGDGGMTGPRITICPGDALPPPASGTCTATADPTDTFLLITGDVLTP